VCAAETQNRALDETKGVADSPHDDGDLSFEHLMGERGHFGRMKEKKRDYGRVIMAVHDKAEALQT